MDFKEIHIGQLIEKRAEELGINKAELARRINTTRQNMDNILAKKSIDTYRLSQISKELNHDFFQYYSTAISKVNIDNNAQNNNTSFYLQSTRNKVSINIEVSDEEQIKSIIQMVLGK